MTAFLTHGRILGTTATTPDLDAALRDYRDVLGLVPVARGVLPADLAASWGCPASAGARVAALRPASGADCVVRLVEQPLPADFRATRTFGWAAFEMTVQDVFGWPARLGASGFEVVGPPRAIPGLPQFVPMQMLGRGREMVYLNEVHDDMPGADLARARSPVDHVFIAILATPDRAATMAWYARTLGLVDGGTHTIPYTMINRAFDLPATTLTTLSMAQAGRLPVIEVDDYPAAAAVRGGDPAQLPAGNAMVTLAVDRFDARPLDFIAPPAVRGGPVYQGRRVAAVFGDAGERIELVEIG